MSRTIVIIPLALALAACATRAAPPPAADQGPIPLIAEPGPTPAADPGPVPLTAKPGPTPAGWAVSIVGTPFALGFKAVLCTASLVIAAPIAGFLTLHPDPSYDGMEVLGDGIANNCGPPWVISPYAAG
jgi:hypothetical protein